MPRLAVLPQELIDFIIDFLQDSQPALISCARVSRAWLPQSRKHLFSSVRAENQTQLRLAARSLGFDSHLSTLVSTLRIDFDMKSYCNPDCVPSVQILKSVLSGSSFSRLRRLFISYMNMTGDTDSPHLLPTMIHTLPSLEHCSLTHFDISLLEQLLILPTPAHSSSLCSLALHDVSIWTQSPHAGDFSHEPTQAEIQHVRSCIDASTERIHLTALDFSEILNDPLMDLLFIWPNACFPWDGIRKIYLDEPQSRFREVICEIGRSLTHLGCSCSSIRPHLDLLNESVLPSLTHLNLMSDSWPWGSDFMHDVLVHLTSVSPFKNLTHLVILTFEGKVTQQLTPDLDHSFTNFIQATPRLQQILIVLQSNGNEIYEEEREHLLQGLPQTAASGILEVVFRSRFECESLYWEEVCPQ